MKESAGKINVKAVYNGDISDANLKSTKVRNKVFLKKQINDNQVDFYLTGSLDIAGLQLNFSLPKRIENIILLSDYFDMSNGSQALDNTKSKLRFVLLKDINGNAEKPLFSIKCSNEVELAEVSLELNSKILLPNYITANIETLNKSFPESHLLISPNPSSGFFIFEGPNVQILEVSDISGKKVPFLHSGDKLELVSPPGLYIIRLLANGTSLTKKIIKI